MTKKTFVCLANSDRNNGRCVAGILVKKAGSAWTIVRDTNGEACWIRPVTKTGEGEIPTVCVKDFKLLDVIEVDFQEACPVGHQKENYYFDLTSLRKVDSLTAENSFLSQLLDNKHTTIFEGLDKFVLPEQSLDYSLMFVKADQVKDIDWEVSPWNPLRRTLKIDFIFNSNEYKFFPIKDPLISEIYKTNPKYYSLTEYDFYLTLSLAGEYQLNKKRYKLVAGIIPILKTGR